MSDDGRDVDVENLIDDTEEEVPDQISSEGEVTRIPGYLGELQTWIVGRVAADPVDIDTLVRDHYGRPISENDRRHARVRQAVARLAWPSSYGLPGPPVVTVELPTDRVFGRVSLA